MRKIEKYTHRYDRLIAEKKTAAVICLCILIPLVHFYRWCLEYLHLVHVVIGWVNRSQTTRIHCHDWNFSFNNDDWWAY
ncbi:hypothetical protein OtV2_205 [Ostreococcus tauri virus 2]|uniref:hypothetical protein n=1 Tax=Ostreococcus tauri virus 2 TaxID=696472 RepID=UPI0001EF46A1|nr:hypothetical protein OtV2_205 [Ostreococcus tauri virus 2]CBI70204.1 hypothetical protein OtV2_205 [Ostreococcus tauri virus 2]